MPPDYTLRNAVTETADADTFRAPAGSLVTVVKQLAHVLFVRDANGNQFITELSNVSPIVPTVAQDGGPE